MNDKISEPLDLIESSDKLVDNRSKNVSAKATVYIASMLIFSVLLIWMTKTPFVFFSIMLSIFISIGIPLLIASLVEVIRKFRREKKQKQTGIRTLKNPLWFEILESAFSIWLLMALVSAIPLLIGAFR